MPQNLKYFIILLVIIFLNVSQISFSYYKMEIKYLIINITKKKQWNNIFTFSLFTFSFWFPKVFQGICSKILNITALCYIYFINTPKKIPLLY